MSNKSIKNRIFGSDIPSSVKRKIEVRQIVAESANYDTNVLDEIIKKYDTEGGGYSRNFPSTDEPTSLADLSSRSPFIRMWTAVELTRDVVMQTLTEDELKKFNDERSDNPDGNFKNKPIRDLYTRKRQSDGVPLLYYAEPIKNSIKTYQLGNHVLTQEPKDPLTTRENLKEIKSEDQNITISKSSVHKIFPNQLEFNEHLQPPAGITSLESSTDGPLGSLKTTTVNFVVHDFNDFERIYLRYFLKPGAQVFVDFGWDTSQLYDINKALNQENGLEEYFYGKNGVVPNSEGDLDCLIGHVVNYDAKVRQDGGFDCSLEIVSKNSAILSQDFDERTKDRIMTGLQYECLAYGIAGAVGDESIYHKATQWGQSTQTKDELLETLYMGASRFLGGITTDQPGEDSVAGIFSLQQGIFFKGDEKDLSTHKIYINFGWFEDNVLNKELGYDDSFESLINKDKSASKTSDKTFKAKFNSRNAFVTYNEGLNKASISSENTGVGNSMLYPAVWGIKQSKYSTYYPDVSDKYEGNKGQLGITYNIVRDMVPDRFINGVKVSPGDTNWPSDYPNDFYYNAYKNDLTNHRMPIRELFLSFDMIKESAQAAGSIIEFIEEMFTRIKTDTHGIIDLAVSCDSYGGHTLSFVDKNVLFTDEVSEAGTNDDTQQSRKQYSEFLDKLLVFKPYHPQSIVKSFDLNFQMPEGGLGNMLAVQSSTTLDTKMSVNDMVDGFIKFEDLERSRDSIKDTEQRTLNTRYFPSVGKIVGKRFENNIKYNQNINSFNIETKILKDMQNRNAALAKYVNFQGLMDANNDAVTNIRDFKTQWVKRLDNSVNDNVDAKGVKINKKPKEESREDTTESAKDMAAKEGHTLVKDPAEYFMKKVLTDVLVTRAAPLEVGGNLTIYGISSFVPGDVFRIDYLPKHYRKNVFFQVMAVKQSVGTTWTTTFETQMRVAPSPRQKIYDEEATYAVSKKWLHTTNPPLNEISEYTGIFGNLIPVDIPKGFTMIDHCFHFKVHEPLKDRIDFPTLWTRATDEDMKNLQLLKTTQRTYEKEEMLINSTITTTVTEEENKTKFGVGGGHVTIEFDDAFNTNIFDDINGGVANYMENIPKDAVLVLWTSGKDWLITNDKASFQDMDEIFGYTGEKNYDDLIISEEENDPTTNISPAPPPTTADGVTVEPGNPQGMSAEQRGIENYISTGGGGAPFMGADLDASWMFKRKGGPVKRTKPKPTKK